MFYDMKLITAHHISYAISYDVICYAVSYREICTCMHGIHLFFCTLAPFSLLAAGLFSRSRLRGMQGARLHSRRKFRPGPCVLWAFEVARAGK